MVRNDRRGVAPEVLFGGRVFADPAPYGEVGWQRLAVGRHLPMSPRVVHLVAGELDGGAARGAYWLHRALLELGVRSTLLHNGIGSGTDPTVRTTVAGIWSRARQRLDSKWSRLPLLAYPRRQRTLFSLGTDGLGVAREAAFIEADIVHLHWFNGLLPLRDLRAIDRPVVWTLRDMWPFTGGCHYTMGCSRYTQGCGACPQLGSRHARDLSWRIAGAKRLQLPPQLTAVGISEWVSECARASTILAGRQIETIPNGIDTKAFSPMPARQARQLLGLPEDRRIVTFAAQYVRDAYKGFDHLRRALAHLDTRGMHLLIVGRTDAADLADLPAPYTTTGFITDDARLRQAYAASDLLAAPSVMEAFGKSLAEAQACGTPVVCFDASGPRDIVEHRVTGWRAQPFEAVDLAAGMRWVLNLPPDVHASMRQRCRQRAVETFDSTRVACHYMALYDRILQR